MGVTGCVQLHSRQALLLTSDEEGTTGQIAGVCTSLLTRREYMTTNLVRARSLNDSLRQERRARRCALQCGGSVVRHGRRAAVVTPAQHRLRAQQPLYEYPGI
eukprot:4697856-Pleurochrysis_carterae.AAC.3